MVLTSLALLGLTVLPLDAVPSVVLGQEKIQVIKGPRRADKPKTAESKPSETAPQQLDVKQRELAAKQKALDAKQAELDAKQAQLDAKESELKARDEKEQERKQKQLKVIEQLGRDVRDEFGNAADALAGEE